MSLSDELRDELAAIAPRRRCCRLAELSALFHTAGAWHLRGHGELAVHLDLASPAAARRAFTLLRDLGVRSEIRTYRRRAFDRATRYQLHVEVDAAAAARSSAKPAFSRRAARRSSARRSASSADRAAAAPTSAARCSAAARSRARARRTWSFGRPEERGRVSSQGSRSAKGLRSSVLERPSHAIAYAKGGETIADLLAVAGASETALRLDEHAVVAATRAHANRLANADEANLVRITRLRMSNCRRSGCSRAIRSRRSCKRSRTCESGIPGCH